MPLRHQNTQNAAPENGEAEGESGVVFQPLLVELSDALLRCNDVRQADTEPVIDDDDFTLGDQGAVDQDIHGLAGQTVQLND
jgi:hypothetical protein